MIGASVLKKSALEHMNDIYDLAVIAHDPQQGPEKHQQDSEAGEPNILDFTDAYGALHLSHKVQGRRESNMFSVTRHQETVASNFLHERIRDVLMFSRLDKRRKETVPKEIEFYLRHGAANCLNYPNSSILKDFIGHYHDHSHIDPDEYLYIPLLLKYGANPDWYNEVRMSGVLNTAVALNMKEIVAMLLDAGANPNTRDFYGKRPIDYAVSIKGRENYDYTKMRALLQKKMNEILPTDARVNFTPAGMD
jgi:hypothetical protein